MVAEGAVSLARMMLGVEKWPLRVENPMLRVARIMLRVRKPRFDFSKRPLGGAKSMPKNVLVSEGCRVESASRQP
jgi:hypothetical protein